jgi:hypothetical protein
MIDRHKQLLHECYLTGQMSEAQWQQHLREDPELAAFVADKSKPAVPRRFAWHPRVQRWFRVRPDENNRPFFSAAIEADIEPGDETYLLAPESTIPEVVIQ